MSHYVYNVTGVTTMKGKGNKVTVSASGQSEIKFRACDKAGNCSDFSSERTIKIDKTAPSLTTSINIKSDGTGTINVKVLIHLI